ncbi:MAG: hypothetical protein LBQ56_07110, partial [Synergistaceae bacterium]|nr:hypothetical protein [Synergistaceae bacterium]
MPVITVKQGEYRSIPCDDRRAYTLKSGRVEIYACTPEGSETYHKEFLAALEPQGAFFPIMDPGAPFEISVFAITDSEIQATGIDRMKPEVLAELSGRWLKDLTELQWVSYIAGMGHETVLSWSRGAPYGGTDVSSRDAVAEALMSNQRTLSELISDRFAESEHHADERARGWARQRIKTMSAAMSSIISAENKEFEGGDLVLDADDPVLFVVRTVARRFGVATENIKLPQDVASRLDPLTLMRRLVAKANMQLRLVTLPKGWHRSDAGTLIGYYGDDDEIAALIPESSKRYRLVSASNPHGIRVNDAVASKLREDAFICYPGLPPRTLGAKDMLGFAMKNTWKHDWWTIWVISLLSVLLAIVMPMITSTIFEDIIPINDRQALGTVTQVMLVSGFTTAVLGLVRSVAFRRVKSHSYLVEYAMWSRLLSLPSRFFRQYEVGNLLNRMQGIQMITEILDNGLLSAIFDSLFSFTSLILMFYYSFKLSLWVMIPWAAYLAISAFAYKKLVFFAGKKVKATNETSARTLQILSGL